MHGLFVLHVLRVMPVHILIAACSPFAGPWPFLPSSSVCCFASFLEHCANMLQPCGHVWGLTMRKCAP